jgi:hypothetical protein
VGLDFEDAGGTDMVLVAGDIFVGELLGIVVEDGFGHVGDANAVGEVHIIMMRAPRQQQREAEHWENLLHTEKKCAF